MGATDWVLTLILGGILGMIGQGIRMVMGLKKVSDQASAEGKNLGSVFESSRLMVSLLIGFIAGSLAIIGVTGTMDVASPSKELIVTIIGAGYAGTDFIEGFIKKSMPATPQTEPKTVDPEETEQPAMG